MSLDPKTNADVRAAARKKTNKPKPLNPDFPFTRVPFDPFFFHVEQDPPKPPTASPGSDL
jgi:hypothetical protein